MTLALKRMVFDECTRLIASHPSKMMLLNNIPFVSGMLYFWWQLLCKVVNYHTKEEKTVENRNTLF